MTSEDDPRSDAEIELEQKLFERRFFLDSLGKDVQKSDALIEAATSDEDVAFACRTYVRTVFAEIEGMCASELDWARYYSTDDSALKDRYTEAERAVLRGALPRLSDRGEPSVEEPKHSTKGTIRFALCLVGRGAEVLSSIEYGDGGWDALMKAMRTRDRLMHPKKTRRRNRRGRRTQ
jgi:hypothetical protein